MNWEFDFLTEKEIIPRNNYNLNQFEIDTGTFAMDFNNNRTCI